MIGSLLGGAIGIASSIWGGRKASEAMKGVKQNIEQQQRENEDWYNRRYNEDATQRADAQRILQLTAENFRKRNQQAAGTAAVMGGTEESVAATKAANAQAMADAASQIAVNGEKRKEVIEQQYLQRDATLNEKLNQAERDKAKAITEAAGGVASAAGSAGEAFDKSFLAKFLAGID